MAGRNITKHFETLKLLLERFNGEILFFTFLPIPLCLLSCIFHSCTFNKRIIEYFRTRAVQTISVLNPVPSLRGEELIRYFLSKNEFSICVCIDKKDFVL